MDITGYLFMICKDIFFHARYSCVYPFISFVSSSFFIDVLHFILTYPHLSYYFIPFILLFYPLYPAILSLLSRFLSLLSCFFILLIIRSGPGLIRIVAAPA